MTLAVGDPNAKVELPAALANVQLERGFRYKPTEARAASVWRKNWLATALRLSYPTARLNEILSARLPQETTTVLARTGNAKTTFALAMALEQAERLLASPSNDIVVFISWEEGIDKLQSMLENAVVARHGEDLPSNYLDTLPLHFIGYSMMRSTESGYTFPPLTLDVVARQLHELIAKPEEGGEGLHPIEVYFDYLQMIPSPQGRSRPEEVGELMEYAHRLSQQFVTSSVCLVQSGRVTDENKFGMPTLHDAQWSSVIEQRSVRMLALSRPIMQGVEGDEVEFLQGVRIPISHNLLLAETLKDRNGKPRGRAALHFEPEQLLLKDMELGVVETASNGHQPALAEPWQEALLE